jgi:diguanylate cyclase (GGDEF)-like protein
VDGAYLWILDRAIKIEHNEEGEVIRMIGAHQNIDSQKTIQNELKEKNKELEKKVAEVQYLSYTDTLTQIPNRRKFAMDIEKEVARAKRYGHYPSMIIMDIDYFKNVNDNYGHKVGDSVLRQLSTSMQEHLRVNDFIYRWGDEEFAILLPETNAQETIYVAEKLRKYISQLCFEQNLSLTCSFGVAQYDKTQTIDQLFVNTDRAVYKAKELGRNRVEILP